MDMLHECASNATCRKVSRYEEVIDVTGILEIGIAGHTIFDGRDERAQGGDPVCPVLLVMDDGRPGIELLRRVEATGKPVNGRHEHTPQFRLFAWNEIADKHALRSEEHTSELQSLMRISYAVFCLKKKTN